MQKVNYEATDGRKFWVWVPDDCFEHDYHKGIHIGPPDLDARLADMGWPKELRVKFHNELFNRNLIELKDVMKAQPHVIDGAIKATFKISMNMIPQWYREECA